jgi:sugar phosphate isomerase/epimerase
MALKIGVFVDNLGRPIAEGLKLAAQWRVACFQVYLTAGEMLAENMPPQARADFAKRYRDLGLQLSATCGDFGLNFGDAELMEAKEPLLRAAIEQTVDLGAAIMTTHIGSVGEDPDRLRTMAETLKRIGDYAASRGVTLATETGLESGPRLRAILTQADTSGIAVNFDPANLVMKGFDHLDAARELRPFIVHTHAKDGKRGNGEAPLGEGDVDFPAYVHLMTELGYDGAYVIEREVGDDPVGDVQKAIDYLRGL